MAIFVTSSSTGVANKKWWLSRPVFFYGLLPTNHQVTSKWPAYLTHPRSANRRRPGSPPTPPPFGTMPGDNQTSGKDAVSTVDTAGGRVARSSRARTRKSSRVATRQTTAVANKGEGEGKFGNPTPQNRPPDVANVAGVADVSPVAVAASAIAAGGDATPPAQPQKFPVAEPKWPRQGRGGHHPGTGPQRGRWVRRLRVRGGGQNEINTTINLSGKQLGGGGGWG